MWYLHGDEQQGCIAQLQSFYVYEVLPKLVSSCYFVLLFPLLLVDFIFSFFLTKAQVVEDSSNLYLHIDRLKFG